MSLELYTKSKENIENIFKKDMRDMDYIASLIESLEMNFKNIEFHKYGEDNIIKSTTEKIHIYTNGNLEFPKYNWSETDSIYIMVYNNRIFKLSYSDIDFKNEIIKGEEYYGIEEERRFLKNRKLYAIDYVDSSNDYSLEECILTNYGLFVPIGDIVHYSLNEDKVTNLDNMIDNINTQDYYYSENLGLTFEYCKEYNLNKILYNYQEKAIFGKYIILFDTFGYVKFDKKLCNSVEESLKYLKDKKEYKKYTINECDDIPF